MEQKIKIAGTLLIPIVQHCNRNYTFAWVGTMHSNQEDVNVIAFNDADKNKFYGIMEKDFSVLKQLKQEGTREIAILKKQNRDIFPKHQEMRNIKNQMKFIKQTLSQMNCSVYHKTPHKEMLEIISRKTGTNLHGGNVIYLAGLK